MRRTVSTFLILVAASAGLVGLIHAQSVDIPKPPFDVTARNATILRGADGQTGPTIWKGDVSIIINGVTLHADEATFIPKTQDLELRGNVHVTLPTKAK